MPRSVEDIFLDRGITDDEAELIRVELGNDGLRKKLGKAEAEAARVPDLEAKVSKLEQGPARVKGLEEAGFDTEKLSQAAKDALATLKTEGDAPTEEEFKAFAEYHGIPEASGGGGAEGGDGNEPKPGAEGVTNFSKEQGNGSGDGGTLIKPEEASAWSATDRAKFRQSHPEAWSQLLQGKEVTAPFTPSG